jgi:glutamine synthetase
MSSKASTQAANAILLGKYLALKQPEDKVQVTYVWNDNRGDFTKSKSRVVSFVPKTPDELPLWNFGLPAINDKGEDYAIENFLKPVVLYADPFRGGNNKLVWCEPVNYDGSPVSYNSRSPCLDAINKVMDTHEPWFGIEQEYCLTESVLGSDSQGTHPLGWPRAGAPKQLGYDYMYNTGADVTIGREIHEAHFRACLYAGINMFGENAECMPAQWEYQVGPCTGIGCADDLWMSRFILRRVAEDFRVAVSFDPRAFDDDWPASGLHTNFSTKQTRDKATGMAAIEDAIHKLNLNHNKHMQVYDLAKGKDNERRLKGGITNCQPDVFTSGIGARDASVRIPQQVADEGCGYLEDRRPASNADPYAVMEAIVRTTLLSKASLIR